MTANIESRIQDMGASLIESSKKAKKSGSVVRRILDAMMEDDAFRIAALKFTDVAPTLKTDAAVMSHFDAYFKDIPLTAIIGKIPAQKLIGIFLSPIIRKSIQQMAQTYIVAENMEKAAEKLEGLHKNNMAVSVDLLGEAVISETEAKHFFEAYEQAIETLSAATQVWEKPNYPEADAIGIIPRGNLSIKLSALYAHMSVLDHEHSKNILVQRFSRLLSKAKAKNVYIHIDMEQYTLLPQTLDIFKQTLMQNDFRMHKEVGIVVQAYLKDSHAILEDLIQFAQERGTPFSIRLVKGAYWDYEQAHAEQENWPCPVYDNKEETDANYERCLELLLKSYPKVRPLIGSHNARSVACAIALQESLNLKKADIEFQMLYGMSDALGKQLADLGYRVRVYCPVGEFIPGMSYLVRRLLENTANQGFLSQQQQKNNQGLLLKKPEIVLNNDEEQHEPQKQTGFKNAPLLDFSKHPNRIGMEKAINQAILQKNKAVFPIVNGKEFKSAINGYSHMCPWDKSTITTRVHFATKEEAIKAINAAKHSAWSATTLQERVQVLRKAAELMKARRHSLAATQVFEVGKDRISADADVCEAIDFLTFYADEAEKLGQAPRRLWGEHNEVIYEARGLSAVIAPWNFPLAISCGMVSAALVMGNPVLYKPAEQSSYTAKQFYDIMIEAGLPKDALAFLPGLGEEVGAFLVSNQDIAQIAFTGSKDVGLHIVEQAAKKQPQHKQIKKVIAELGGKNAMIIDEDADLDEVLPALVHSAFAFQGQKCSACSRAIIIGTAYDTLCERLKEYVNDLRLGSPLDTANDINAVIDKEAFDKINGLISEGLNSGKLLAQSQSTTESGYFIPATVFTDIPLDATLTKEEVFGPVLCIYKAKNVDEALQMALDSDFALTGGFFSRHPEHIEQVKRQYKVGNLYINRGITGAMVSRQPFGGGKLSGTAAKAGGADYLYHFAEPRIITENTMRRGYAPKEDS